jgi:hypothetical protein
MPTVHTRFVTYNRKGGRRLHAGTATDDITTPTSTTVTDGGHYQAWTAPEASWTDASGHHSASFAFWAVTGSADGAFVDTDTQVDVHVGSTDVEVVAWYLPTGGNGNGGPAYFIDAFDVNEGRFFDEDFVSISPDAGLSANANETGVVPTGSAEDILAVGSITSVPFDDWTVFVAPAPQVQQATNLHAAAQATAVAFAFYRTPDRVIVKPPRDHYAAGTWVSFGVTVDGGGPTGRGPVPPWDPYIRELAAGLALADTARLVSPELRGQLTRLASEQVELATKQITAAMGAAGAPQVRKAEPVEPVG